MSEPMNGPIVRKRMPICEAVGEYVNGQFEGDLSPDRFAEIVRNFRKYPRQVPIYLLVGDPDPTHPEDLDSKVPVGWVEGVETDGRFLWGNVKLHGDGARYVAEDLVRGASIGTVAGKDYDGTPIGEVLEHVVLTNNPFVKGMNIAASRAKGGEAVASYFTALPIKEAPVADDKKEKPKLAPAAEDKGENDVVTLKEELEAAEMLLKEQQKKIEDLSTSNDELATELRERQKNSDLELALKENKSLQRQVLASKIRELVALGVDRGQFKRDTVLGYDGGDDRSDALTLKWFTNSDMFKGNMDLLKFALKTFPKTTMRRGFVSGAPGDDEAAGYSAEQREAIEKAGHNPDLMAKTRGAENLTDYKRRKAAAAKG